METPFTIEEFFGVFKAYNSSVFPIQLLFMALGVAVLFLIHKKRNTGNALITGFLAFIWLWTGIVYQIIFFTSINRAAFVFGGLFIVQGLLFLVGLFRKAPDYVFERKAWKYIGCFFLWFGLIIYPVISYSLEESFARTISLGLPCPTTIFTFGLLMLTGNRFPKYLLIIPTIWAIIGTVAAINFGVYQDYMMIISAVAANIYLIKRKG